MKPRNMVLVLATMSLFTFAKFAMAQTAPSTAAEATDQLNKNETTANSSVESLNKEFKQYRQTQAQKLQSLEDQLRAQQTKTNEATEKLNDVLAKQEEQEIATLTESQQSLFGAFERKLDIFGFFDTTFIKNKFDSDTPSALYLYDQNSFVMGGINLYIQSRMTQRLTALVELGLSFLPHGNVNSFPAVFELPDGSEGQTQGEYDRTDTTIRNPLTVLPFRQHGLSIERAHLTYAYREWLQLVVGRYLTPFGIWNVDHATTVLVLTQHPHLMITKPVPLAQTGIQLSGRLFATQTWYFDYALTLSNGRGPMDEVWDLDNNKAMGMRLRANYEHNQIFAAVGSYLYYGKYRDSFTSAKINSTDMSIGALDMTTSSYDEVVATFDILFRIHGVRLQSEAFFRRVSFDVRPEESENDKIAKSIFGATNTYTPDHIGYGAYGLISYRLPWTLRNVEFEPFAFSEVVNENDTRGVKTISVASGVDIVPSSSVVVKLEWMRTIVDFTKDTNDGTVDRYAIQMAVAF